MDLKNPFPPSVRYLFLYKHECWECGKNGSTTGGLELHHIWGRVSSSALNAAPLCHMCHERVGHTREEHQRYLRKTVLFISCEGYKLREKDDEFLALTCVQDDLRGFTL